MIPSFCASFRAPAAAAALIALATLSAGEAAAQQAPIMFRGNPAHTGVLSGRLFEGQGGVRWRVQTGGVVRSTPAVTATRVFVGSGDGRLYSIDRATGSVVWRFDAGAPVHASPAVAGGLVIAATLAGRIFAVDESTGRARWSMRTGPTLPLNAPRASNWDHYVSSPVVAGRTVVIGGGDGGVYALELATGRQRWRGKTGGRVRATPAVSGDGLVVVGSWDGRVYAYDLATGAERWVHRTAGDTLDSRKWGFDRRAVQSSAAIADGAVYVGSRDGGLYALDLATGARRWRLTHHGSWVVGSPAVAAGRVYVGSSDGHFVQAVDPTGREIWHTPTEDNMNSSPLLVGGLLVIGSYNTEAPRGDLQAFDAATGARRWYLRLDEGVASSPVAAGGELYVGTEGGAVVAIGETSRVVPHLAVYYDSTLSRKSVRAGGLLAREYFRHLGYDVLDADSLPRFLEARISDGAPSAVVCAIDALPPSVVPVAADSVLLRRYLNAGGKIVWLGAPVESFIRDTAGQITDFKPELAGRILGLPMESADFNQNAAHPTVAGRRWGLPGSVIRGDYPIAPSAPTEVLALDEVGATTAWVRVYRPDRPGAGFVQLWGFGAALERLPAIRAAAEYGLMRSVEGRASSGERRQSAGRR